MNDLEQRRGHALLMQVIYTGYRPYESERPGRPEESLENWWRAMGLETCPYEVRPGELCGAMQTRSMEFYPYCNRGAKLIGEGHRGPRTKKHQGGSIGVSVVWLQCDECGSLFVRPLTKYMASVKRQAVYTTCGKSCWGQIVARQWGFRLGRLQQQRERVNQCKRGHAFTEENTLWVNNGKYRHCKACARWRYRHPRVRDMKPVVKPVEQPEPRKEGERLEPFTLDEMREAFGDDLINRALARSSEHTLVGLVSPRRKAYGKDLLDE